jgi:hypothetical protein
MSYAGVLAALSVVAVFIATVFPTGRLFLLGASSLALVVVFRMFGAVTGLISLVSAMGAVWLFLPGLPTTVFYSALAAPYAAIYTYARGLPGKLLPFSLRFFFLNIAAYMFVLTTGGSVLASAPPQFLIMSIVGAEVGLLIFDWAVSLFGEALVARLQKRLKGN